MKVGPKEADRHEERERGPKQAQPRRPHPKDRDKSPGFRRVPGWERTPARAPMEEAESIRMVRDPGGIVVDPGFGPRAAKEELELILDRDRDNHRQGSLHRGKPATAGPPR